MHSALFAFYNDGVSYSFNYSDDEDKVWVALFTVIIEVGLLVYHISMIPYSISDGRVAFSYLLFIADFTFQQVDDPVISHE